MEAQQQTHPYHTVLGCKTDMDVVYTDGGVTKNRVTSGWTFCTDLCRLCSNLPRIQKNEKRGGKNLVKRFNQAGREESQKRHDGEGVRIQPTG